MRKTHVLEYLIVGISTVSAVYGAVSCKDKKPYEPFIDGNKDKYHICLGPTETPLTIPCPNNLQFNEETKSCTLQLSARNPSTNDCITGNEKFNDPDNDEQNCNKFKQCDLSSGTAILTDEECDGIELFNPLKSDCVSPEAWYCESDGPDCDLSRYHGQRLVDKFDCTSYYECIGNVRVKGSCPTGYVFSAETKTCTLSSGTICKTLTSSANLEPINDICKDKTHKFVADPNYCMGYYYCIDETTPYWRTCEEGKYFENGFCSTIRPITCKCEDIKLVAPITKAMVPHQDKSKYYVCYQNKAPEVRSCPSGTKFKAELKSCVRS